jgi:beta-lactam-binding protein with PASTA domain
VTVPSLFGLSEADAVATIRDAGLSLGGVIFVTQANLPPGVDITVVPVGYVLIQSPAPGVQVPAGTPVTFYVRAE